MNRAMSSCLMQDWITVGGAGASGVLVVTQPSATWLDLAAARDAVFYLEVSAKDSPDSATLEYETSPTRDASQFRSMASRVMTPALTPYVQRVTVYDNPPVPLARWVRWRITYPAAALWNVTFRSNVMAYGR